VLIARKRLMTQFRRAQRPGPEGVWPKRRRYGVAELDPGITRTLHSAPCIGAFWDANAIRG